MARGISVSDKGNDILSCRDVHDLLEEMQDERAALADCVTDAETELEELDDDATPEEREKAEEAAADARDALKSWDEENGDALKELEEFTEYMPLDGTLIHDSYFQKYAQQTAEDIGAIDPKAGWPLDCIDWERAASELQSDYSEYDWGSETYWCNE